MPKSKREPRVNVHRPHHRRHHQSHQNGNGPLVPNGNHGTVTSDTVHHGDDAHDDDDDDDDGHDASTEPLGILSDGDGDDHRSPSWVHGV
jgi:hypothetical protein